MKKNSNDRSQRHGILARVQPTKQILFHAVVRSGFRRCGGAGPLLVLLCLFFSSAQVQAQTDALGTTTLLEGPAVGADSVVLAVSPATEAWTATANDSWLHLSAANQSGTGSTNVVFTFDANPGATRTGTLTVAGQTLTVTQAGSTYVAANPITTLVSSGLNTPYGVAVDGAGNVYIADEGNALIKKWTAASGIVTTLVSSGLYDPGSVAVDGAGNVYIADQDDPGAIYQWTAASGTVTTLVSSGGLSYPNGVAVDGAGNVYIADTYNNAIKEMPRAFVDPTAITEGSAAVSDVLPSVLPASENLLHPFAPTSSQLWLTTSGVANGVVSFAFTANPSVSRTANIILLGKNIVVTQAGLITAALGTNALTEEAAPGSDSVALAVPSPTGPWTATANAYWLHLSAANQSGVGSTNVVFTFDASPGPPRVGTLTIAGQTLTVTQVGTNSLGTTTLVEGPAAGADSVVLTMFGPIAAWTAAANASWLHLSAANQSGTGSINVVITFDANPGATRTGTLTVAGLTLTVTQAGSTYVSVNPVTTLVSSGLSHPGGVAVDGPGNVYIADSANNAIKKWTAASGTVTTLVSAGLNGPSGLAVDGGGNVYFCDPGNNAIKKWTVANNTVTTLVASGLSYPAGVAVDGAGNVYIADSGNNAIKEWVAASGAFTTLVSSGLSGPNGVAVDGAGNVYIADFQNNALKKWTAATHVVSTLASAGQVEEYFDNVAVDGAGNVYIVDSGKSAIRKWTAASGTVTTLVSSGLYFPAGVAVDGTGNVYIADSYNQAIKELPRAFVDPTAMTEGAEIGSDVLPSVLPASENLLAPFAPTSSQSWLTISGVTNGVVSFDFTANTTGATRAAQLTVLGRSITINQTAATAPVQPKITTITVTDTTMFGSPAKAITINFTGPSTALASSYGLQISTLVGGPYSTGGDSATGSGGVFSFSLVQVSETGVFPATQFFRIIVQ